jgi:hypothetical protein
VSGLDAFIDELAERIGHVVLRGLRSAESGWHSQHGSPLSNRRHISAVRRRRRLGLEGAAVVGENYLLTDEALKEELLRLSSERERKIGGKPIDVPELPLRESARARMERKLQAIRERRGNG